MKIVEDYSDLLRLTNVLLSCDLDYNDCFSSDGAIWPQPADTEKQI